MYIGRICIPVWLLYLYSLARYENEQKRNQNAVTDEEHVEYLPALFLDICRAWYLTQIIPFFKASIVCHHIKPPIKDLSNRVSFGNFLTPEMLTRLYFLCIDTASKSTAISFAEQKLCMERFIDPEMPKQHLIRKGMLLPAMLRDKERIGDVCMWQGVQCHNGVVESIHIDMPEESAAFVDMHWLPPDLKYLSLNQVSTVNGWTTPMLPREIRFLLLWHCPCVDDKIKRFVDLNRLPSRMEELHLYNTPLHGKIQIFRLPDAMRVIDIGSAEIRKAYVNFECLPPNFVSMSISKVYLHLDRLKIVGMGETQGDSRVSNYIKGDWRSRGVSQYQEMFPERQLYMGVGSG